MDKISPKIKIYNRYTFKNNNGSVLKIINKNSENYKGFGEVYFSTVKYKVVKGWKLHNKMHMNLMVSEGSIKFVFYDLRKKSNNYKKFKEIILNSKINKIIYVPPKIWFAFQGLTKSNNVLLNFANILHDDQEVSNKNLKEIHYKWK